MKLYKMCIMSLMLMGTYVQADATKEPVCKSIVECDKLSHAIEVQIDELNKKLDIAKDSEIDLIFVKIEKLEQQKTDVLLASKNTELKEEKAKTQAAFEKVSEKLDAIESSLK